jgi:hypothetical protein
MEDKRWIIWGAVIALVVLFRIIGWLLKQARGAGGDRQMDRIAAAAKKVLAEQRQGARSPFPATAPKSAKPPRPSKLRPQKYGQAHSPTAAKSTAQAALAAGKRVPAVVRRGALFGGREPVIQRRR